MRAQTIASGSAFADKIDRYFARQTKFAAGAAQCPDNFLRVQVGLKPIEEKDVLLLHEICSGRFQATPHGTGVVLIGSGRHKTVLL